MLPNKQLGENFSQTERYSYYKVSMKLHITINRALLILASAAFLVCTPALHLQAQSTEKANPQTPARAHSDAHSDEGPGHQHDDGSMPGMNMDDDKGNHAQAGAMHTMTHGHHHMDSAHMRMTPPRPATDEDRRRGEEIATTLGGALEKYKDYHVALAEGFHIFAPNLPQPMYHFTNYWNGYLEGFTFDAARPTSLLYKKTKEGYELIGAMYTAPRTASLEELNERIPLGVARWHEHTNLCMPRRGEATHADWKKFGLEGSISTEEECQAAGGRFYPVIFGWMVHVYPFESESAKVWAQ
jgi:hypothetical protein